MREVFFMKIIVNGAEGRTGRVLCRYIEEGDSHELTAYVDRRYETDEASRRFSTITDFRGDADCIIDFSHRSQTETLCSYAVRRRLPLVIAATGQNDADRALIEASSRFVPVLLSANLSFGTYLFRNLVRIAACEFKNSDIEITELHRRGKADAPSGTALMLSDDILSVRPECSVSFGCGGKNEKKQNEITVHSLRLGDRAGTHTVYFSGEGETVILTHEAGGRLPYAEGAVRAAVFLFGLKAGLYSENDIFRA